MGTETDGYTVIGGCDGTICYIYEKGNGCPAFRKDLDEGRKDAGDGRNPVPETG